MDPRTELQLKIKYGLLTQSEKDWLAEERRNLESYAKRLRGEYQAFVKSLTD